MEASRRRSIVTLTTDFGLADHYVGTMKGVILSRYPDAPIVDVSHELPAFSIWSGAYTIDQAALHFPAGTVHVVVVDPGVGTSRRAILLEASGQRFIAPDNGVLSLVLRRDPNAVAREITNAELFLPNVSSTFHGRDIFAPVAAALAAGSSSPESVGATVKDVQVLNRIDPEETGPGRKVGTVLSVDRFGNVITNFKASESAPIASEHFEIRTVKDVITNFSRTFGAAPPNCCFAYFGSSGYVELGMNRRSAAQFLGVSPGDVVELQRQ